MKDNPFQKLKNAKKHPANPGNSFIAENDPTLTRSYTDLKNHLSEISSQLESTNLEITKKVAQLDTLSHYLQSILHNISQGIVFVRFNGIITTFNPAAEKILERDSLDLLYTPFWDHFEDDVLGFSLKEALKAKKGPETIFSTYESPTQGTKELEIQTQPLNQEENGYQTQDPDNIEIIEGLIITIRDYTETNRLRRIAHRNDRMRDLGEMAAMVAHEIRNPLGGIKGFAALLERDLKDQPHQKKIAHHIVEGANHLNHLVSEVLHYTRPLDILFEPIDLISLLHDIRRHYIAEHPDTKIKFNIETSEDSLIIPIDRYKLRSAILNMVLNACEAMPNGGILTISTKEVQGTAVVTLADTGTGIHPDHIDKIFAPFFTTKTQGNGFGLSEAHKIIQAHEGAIEVQSELGKGATFIIRLPAKTFARNL